MWLADTGAAAQRWVSGRRRVVMRGLLLVLLAELLWSEGRGEPPPRSARPGRAGVLTSHHAWLAFAVLTMLLDHYAKGVLRNGGSLLVLPAQLLGAPVFYTLVGANTSPTPRSASLALLGSFALLNELTPLPGDIQPYTLITIAALRPLLAIATPDPRRPQMHHALIASALLGLDNSFGYYGLQLGYGSLSLLWALAARTRALRRAEGVRWALLEPGWCYDLAALGLHAHNARSKAVAAVRISGGAPGWLDAVLPWVVVPLVAVNALLLSRYSFAPLADPKQCRGGLGCAAVTAAWAVGHYSLWLYMSHLLLLVLLQGSGRL